MYLCNTIQHIQCNRRKGRKGSDRRTSGRRGRISDGLGAGGLSLKMEDGRREGGEEETCKLVD